MGRSRPCALHTEEELARGHLPTPGRTHLTECSLSEHRLIHPHTAIPSYSSAHSATKETGAPGGWLHDFPRTAGGKGRRRGSHSEMHSAPAAPPVPWSPSCEQRAQPARRRADAAAAEPPAGLSGEPLPPAARNLGSATEGDSRPALRTGSPRLPASGLRGGAGGRWMRVWRPECGAGAGRGQSDPAGRSGPEGRTRRAVLASPAAAPAPGRSPGRGGPPAGGAPPTFSERHRGGALPPDGLGH